MKMLVCTHLRCLISCWKVKMAALLTCSEAAWLASSSLRAAVRSDSFTLPLGLKSNACKILAMLYPFVILIVFICNAHFLIHFKNDKC